MSKKETNKKQRNYKPMIGFLELLTVASIAFSTTIIVLGTDNPINLGLVAPQAVFAVVVLVKRFAR